MRWQYHADIIPIKSMLYMKTSKQRREPLQGGVIGLLIVGRLCFGELQPKFQPSRRLFHYSTVSQGSDPHNYSPTLSYQLVSGSFRMWGVLARGWKADRRYKSDFFLFLSASGIHSNGYGTPHLCFTIQPIPHFSILTEAICGPGTWAPVTQLPPSS